MCVAQRRLCQKWVVRGAPKRMSMTVKSGAESERQRRREMMAGVILDPTEAGFDLADWANWTRFRAVGPFEDVGEDVELPED